MSTLSPSPSLRHLDDTQREYAIQNFHRALIYAPDKASKDAAWRSMIGLIKGRSPEAIARLERERGLVRR